MLPLAGRRILITRSRQQASALAALLEARGATSILIPTIETAPPLSYASLDRALASLSTFDWLIFTSVNAVQAFKERTVHHDLPSLDHILTAVIGSATAQAAEKIGLKVTLTPPKSIAESLAQTLLPHIRTGTRVVLVRAQTARNYLPEALTAAGATVTIAEAYRTLIPEDSITALQHLFSDRARHPDVVTFTSSSTATNLHTILEAANLVLPSEILRASIGPITSQTLHDLQLPPHLESPQATVASLVQTIETHFVSQELF